MAGLTNDEWKKFRLSTLALIALELAGQRTQCHSNARYSWVADGWQHYMTYGSNDAASWYPEPNETATVWWAVPSEKRCRHDGIEIGAEVAAVVRFYALATGAQAVRFTAAAQSVDADEQWRNALRDDAFEQKTLPLQGFIFRQLHHPAGVAPRHASVRSGLRQWYTYVNRSIACFVMRAVCACAGCVVRLRQCPCVCVCVSAYFSVCFSVRVMRVCV